MKTFLYFARAYPKQTTIMVSCLVLGALLGGVSIWSFIPLLSVALPGMTGVDPSAADPSRLDVILNDGLASFGLEPTLQVMVTIILVLTLSKAAVELLAKKQVGYTVARSATDLRLGLLRALLATRWSYYTRQPLGHIANAMATEADRSSLAYHHIAQVMSGVIESTVYMSIAVVVSWKATVGAAAASVITVGSLNFLVRMSGKAGRRQTKIMKSLLRRVTDSLQAVKLLKAMGRENLIGPLLEHDTNKLNRMLQRRVFSKEALRALQDPLLVIFILVGVVAATVAGGVAPAELGVLVILFGQTLSRINTVQRKSQAASTESSALWSIRKLIDQAEAQEEPMTGQVAPTLDRGIELHDVTLEYDGRNVLDRLSLEIRAGEITAIIGESGAGKTTLVDIIVGLVRPDDGEVRIDGTPGEEIDLHRWREMIGYVPQEMLLLHDTIRMNVTLGDPELGDAEVEAALRDAGAWEFVNRLPEGIETSVGERGALFSGGQRQRLAVARALVHRPKLLILDEATTALDSESESAVWAAMERLRGRTTVVAISHQAKLVGIADRIYRIEKGSASSIPSARSGDRPDPGP